MVGRNTCSSLSLIATEGTLADFLHCIDGLLSRTIVHLVQSFSIHQQYVGIAKQWEIDVTLTVGCAHLFLPVDAVLAHTHTIVSIHLILIALGTKHDAVVADRHITTLVILVIIEEKSWVSHHL